MPRRSPLCTAFVAALPFALTSTASAQQEPAPGDLRLWTWNVPLGAATGDARFAEIVRVKVFVGARGMTGPEAADAVISQILARALGPGQVSILLQDFGRGDGPAGSGYEDGVALVFHHADGLTDQSVPHWWQTPWMTNGIAEASAWFQAFIDRYRSRQLADSRIPDPARFHFDNELYATGCCDPLWITVFDRMRLDPRWSTEPLTGHFGPGSTPRTAADLYAAAGSPSYELGEAIHTREANRVWFRWWASVCGTAVQGALEQAAYGRIRAAWPGVMVSDYQSSAADGLIDPNRPPFQIRRSIDPWQAGTWANYSHIRTSDFDAPVTYPVHVDHRRPGDTVYNATMRNVRVDVESALFSGTPATYGPLAPWINLVGESLPVGAGNYAVTKADMRRMFAFLRSVGTVEFNLWNDAPSNNASNWSALHGALADAHAFRLDSLTIDQGAVAAGGIDSLRLAFWDLLELNDTNQTIFTAAFAPSTAASPRPPRLRVNLETTATIPEDVAAEVSIFHVTAGQWESLNSARLQGPRSEITGLSGPAADYIDAAGRVLVRVSHATAAESLRSRTDLLQVIGDDPCPADRDADGRITADDIFAFLAIWFEDIGSPFSSLRADFNGDRTVNADDIFAFLAAWFAGC